MPELAIEKQGFRTIYPYKDGKVTEVFGSVFYLVVDRQGEKVMSRRVVKNPFYRVGRSHGVQFARDIGADRVIASDIGENARKMLGQANIDVSSEK